MNSSIQSIKTGVPQGSIVRPLLLYTFINDIIKSTRKFNFILPVWADDTTLNCTLVNFGSTIDEMQSSITSELQLIRNTHMYVTEY